MKEKKHIDRIFQEKLKGLEAAPNDAIWERIHAELHKDKRDRKVIPIWWKIAGIAAGLILMITIGNAIFNGNDADPNNISNEVVDTEDASNKTQEDIQEDAEEKENTNAVLNNNLVPDNHTQVTSSESNNENESNKVTVKNPSNSVTNTDLKEAIVNTSSDQTPKNNNDDVLQLTKTDNTTNNVTTGVAEQNGVNTTSNKNIPENKTTNAVADNIPQDLPEQPAYEEKTSKNINSEPVKTSITDGVAATDLTKDEEKEINSTTDDASPTIEEALALSEDEEDINEKEKVIDRWSVTPNVSPVYYNTLGKGSSIHDQFNNNSKSGQLNMAFGVNASYALSEKLSVRSGINKVNVGYNTNDVVIYQSLSASGGSNALPSANEATLRNIDLKAGAVGISVISGENLAFSQVPEVVSQNLQSSIDQEISFIEVPLELEYKISDKKIGVSLIGGFSTMILNDNNVYADVDNERRLLGEANNINDISYSANLGVGLGIKVTEKIDLNFEPTFKYQIKTFNNTSGDFNPYIVGVTSGLKFKF